MVNLRITAKQYFKFYAFTEFARRDKAMQGGTSIENLVAVLNKQKFHNGS